MDRLGEQSLSPKEFHSGSSNNHAKWTTKAKVPGKQQQHERRNTMNPNNAKLYTSNGSIDLRKPSGNNLNRYHQS